jgi:short-subunit dehydrogenase
MDMLFMNYSDGSGDDALQGGGLIVNICSVSSYVDLPLSAAYCASKAALLSATNVLRLEVEPLGLHVMSEPKITLEMIHFVGVLFVD